MLELKHNVFLILTKSFMKKETKEEIKAEIDKIMEKEGNVKGEVLRDHFLYTKEKEGEGAIEKMEGLLAEYGYPLKFSEIKALEWYKDAYCGIFLLLLKEEFNWSDEDFVKMGETITRYSFIVTKILLKYLVSIDFFLKSAPSLWGRHLDFGELEVEDYNKNEKYAVLRVKNYDIHPLTCLYQKGYYMGLFKYIVREKNIVVEEEKCIYRGDSFHSYKISWF